MLKLTNTLSKKKESFESIKKDVANVYVCGVTPYDYAHLGHGRCYTAFDLLVRVLKFLNYDVVYVRNFTDIDDKILKRAQTELGDIARYPEITKKYINAFNEDVKDLNCLAPTFEPRVTQMMPQIITFIEDLIKKGHAYEAGGDVYFAVDSFKDYGKLSKQKKDDLISGARIEATDKKKNPLDFALWKKSEDGTFWKSPWGYGRPGWHIECSVMAAKYLGKTFDIHGGGRDLIFPHHENEIAQSEAASGKPFANYWMHSGFLSINDEKMSKSLGNFFTIREVLEKFDPEVVRYFLITSHYRSQLNYSEDNLNAAKSALDRLYQAISDLEIDHTYQPEQNNPYLKRFNAAMNDDFNSPLALSVLFDLARDINTLKSQKAPCEEQASLLVNLADRFGLLYQEPTKYFHGGTEVNADEIEGLIAKRNQARKDKDWALADTIRDQLLEQGIEMLDSAEGTSWRKK